MKFSPDIILIVNQGPGALTWKEMPHLIQNTCTKCGACLVECPTGSIIEGQDQFYIDADTCADHAACVAVCPVEAITPMPKSQARHDEEE